LNRENDEEVLALLREIRDAQCEIAAQLTAQRALAEEEMRRSRERVEESLALQRVAVRRQQIITAIAVPSIVACIAAIGYLAVRYL
jgi:hypothetical protein